MKLLRKVKKRKIATKAPKPTKIRLVNKYFW